MESSAAIAPSSPPPPHYAQKQSTRILWIGSQAAGTLRLQIQCCESFKGELLNNEEGDAHVDRTGLLLWPGSFLMCTYLLAGRAELEGGETTQLVVELGAGATGLAGLLLSHFLCVRPSRPRTILTDGDPESVAILSHNAKHHFGGENDVATDTNNSNTTLSAALSADIEVQRLRWGNQDEADALVSGAGKAASLVLGCDILYPSIPQAVIRLLLQTARVLLAPGGACKATAQDTPKAAAAPQDSAKLKGRFVLSFIDRDSKITLRNLLLALREERFEIEDVVAGSYLFSDEKEGFMVEEEEEEETDEDGGVEGEEGRGVPRRRHRRRVQMMGGGRVLVLQPLPLSEGEDEAAATAAFKASDARWFRGIWDVAPPPEVEEWQAPLMSDDEEGEDDST